MSGSLLTAYKTGHQDFYGRDFLVSPDVLIPRPETESLIDMVLSLAGKAYLPGVKPEKAKIPTDAKILDVGTGSGCIAVTLALELPKSKVVGVDISEKALEIAQKNAAILHALQCEFLTSDLTEAVNVADFDVIVANLPYVDRDWDWTSDDLAEEPELALFADDGGLALIKKLLRQISERREAILRHGVLAARLHGGEPPLPRQQPAERSQHSPSPSANCFVCLEADPCQHEAIIKYAENLGFRHIDTKGFAICLKYQR